MNLKLPGTTRNDSEMNCSAQDTTAPVTPSDPTHTTKATVSSVIICSQV